MSAASSGARCVLRAVVVISALGACACVAAPVQSQPAFVRPLAYTRTVLPNGLVALINEDHSAPVVAIDVWYHVGAKNETPGHTGLAHLCEHLMGEGSPNLPEPEKVFIQSVGGTSSRWAETTEDKTHYYATFPSNELEPMLWMESDRMAAPLSMADSAHVASVREVIRQERLHDRETGAFASASSMVVQLLFGLQSPYRFDPLGPMHDLETATASEARRFCLPYYVPNNAVIALSGDVSASAARALITKYFGPIPRGAPVAHGPVSVAHLTAPVRATYEDRRARAPQLWLIWRGVAYSDHDRVALNALGAMLSRPHVGYLSRLLVDDRRLATFVSADNYDLERSGLFQIVIAPRGNTSLTQLEDVVDSALAAFKTQRVSTADLAAFQRSYAVNAITSLQPREARADTLAHDEVFAHDPTAYAKQADAAFSLTPADVQRVARQYLTPGHVVLSLVPAGKIELAAHPERPSANVTPDFAKGAPAP
jgi:zinc protease